MELMHPELRKGLAEERVRTLARDGMGGSSPGVVRRLVAYLTARDDAHESSASLTSLSASSLCSRRTAVYETESRPRPRAAA